MSLLEVIIIAIVEGLTEFLPISSTGHMIIAQHLLGVESNEFTRAFIVNIQFGAILSVVVLYWKRFFQSIQFYLHLLVAFIPAAVIGFLLDDYVDDMLGSVLTVAFSLLLGGVVLIFIDKYLNPKQTTEVTYKKAATIGFFQCLAMVPGVSRSAITIIGGMTQGLTRKQAAEFSFFLAVPTMFAASAYKIYTGYETVPGMFEGNNLSMLIVGNVVAFVVALLAIKFFIAVLTKHGFKAFGWYRIVMGALLAALLLAGVDFQMA
jgi:undecaprenyl-diphosphatase